MPLDDWTEDVLHRRLVKRVDADEVEVTQEAVRHVVAATARWTHRCQHDDVLKVEDAGVFPGVYM